MNKKVKTSGHYLVIQADFYTELAAAQKQGAIAELEMAGVSYDVVSVPGALEIPAAIAMATAKSCPYDGFIALGCVIRGETTHYETVCTESSRGLMDLAIQRNLAIGNGILTVENSEQAWERADINRKDKGGDAARAALAMVAVSERYAEDRKIS
jgi:6,7-dimethyl-8-ribityllumazine synthase